MNRIVWTDNGEPRSTLFDDVYFSKQQGLAETRYVFLQHNRLAERFQQLKAGDQFTIGETGFGTGLNFLACWQLWCQAAHPDAQLTFISTEKYPLTAQQLAQALSLWPELAPFAQQLQKQYRLTCSSAHSPYFLYFVFERVRLILIIDDAAAGLRKLLAAEHPDYYRPQWQGVDAWCLDGFAPVKNPSMWRLELFQQMVALSQEGSTFATFTAAGLVRRNLAAAGFAVTKVKGFASKREMLTGRLDPAGMNKPDMIKAIIKKSKTPWSVDGGYQPLPAGGSIGVIGAGLAGCHMAYALAKRGYKVSLFDRNDRLAGGASGNPQGIVYAKLSPHPGMLSDFNFLALNYAQQLYQQFWQQNSNGGAACGVLQLDRNQRVLESNVLLAQQLAGFVRHVTAGEASELAGLQLTCGGLFFPNTGWVDPQQVCQWLVRSAAITVLTQREIHRLNYEEGAWCLSGNDQQPSSWSATFDALVLACANETKDFAATQWLPTKPIRGQVSYLPPLASPERLTTVLCAEGYMAPVTDIADFGPCSTVGASYNLGDTTQTLNEEDHQGNTQLLQPYVRDLILGQAIGGRVGFRCTSPDYLPLAGPVPDQQAFESRYRSLTKNARHSIDHSGHYLPHLYMSLAHGSRGLVYAPLAAEIIASRIGGQAPPVAESVVTALNPARFLIRQLVKSQK